MERDAATFTAERLTNFGRPLCKTILKLAPSSDCDMGTCLNLMAKERRWSETQPHSRRHKGLSASDDSSLRIGGKRRMLVREWFVR